VKAHAQVSIEMIARETSTSERSVRRAIRALTMLGILSRVGTDEYVIHADVLEQMPKVSADA
jgi:predicted DNA-binding transcriptional regulator YafY